jgi:hypothetical protein
MNALTIITTIILAVQENNVGTILKWYGVRRKKSAVELPFVAVHKFGSVITRLLAIIEGKRLINGCYLSACL